jgi:2-polyprenyl-3-methyl-5-hydroxy-6-metoxy-1,4-benzoquinol methylase
MEGEEPWLNRLPGDRAVRDRFAWLADAVRERRVAHVGFADVGCEVSGPEHRGWLHERLAASAREIVGLDLSPDAVAAARADGWEAHAVDCTDPSAVRALGLPRFECVVLGEVIEHVDNAGGLLDGMRELVEPDGLLVVTTPNARRFTDCLYALAGRELVHPDHVAIYSARTLQSLLVRRGWQVVSTLSYVNPPAGRRARSPKEFALLRAQALGRLLARTVAPFVGDGLIVVARPGRPE